MTQNIFEVSTRKAFRFTSNKGELSTEQLWSLPLSASNGCDLNNVAIAVNRDLKAVTEESFVSVVTNPGKADLETKLEIVKHIIATKQAENAARNEASANAAKREKLLNALANQEDAALTKMTPEEIKAEIAKLG